MTSKTLKQYSYESIIDGSTIHYDAMTGKHVRMLVELLGNIERKVEKDTSFPHLLRRILSGLIDVDDTKLYYADWEQLIFLIRSKSFGSKIGYTVGSGDSLKDYEFDINKNVKILGTTARGAVSVSLADKSQVVIAPLTVEEYFSIDENLETVEKDIEKQIICLRKVKSLEESIVELVDIDQKTTFFDSLSIADYQKIKSEIEMYPRVELQLCETQEGTGAQSENEKVKKVSFGANLRSNFFKLS